MDRPEQLDLDGLEVWQGIFAPAIRYHNGLFYITCTVVGKRGNFVVTSKNAAGPWSNPVWIPQIGGIDPSMFFDDDGKAYIVYNSDAPDNKPLYDGHRTIRLYEFAIDELRVIGDEMLLVNGGTDLSKNPVWIEGPHLFKVNGLYYLIAAEGGTAEQHSEVVFRSLKVQGPYIPYEKNPILTQRHLDPHRADPITSTGHADLVQTDTGEWWAVFLGCRPYPPVEENFYNTGRETFLAPVRWIDGWPVINPDFEEIQYHYPRPNLSLQNQHPLRYSGNFNIRDDFDTKTLGLNWVMLRTPREDWYDLSNRPGFLSLRLRPETCSGSGNPSFLGHRQQHLQGSATISMQFKPNADFEKAGLLVFQNERHFYFLCQSRQAGLNVVQLYKSGTDQHMELLASKTLNINPQHLNLYLKVAAKGNTYSCSYSLNQTDWSTLKDDVDATFLSTRVAGGFTGCMYALYATSSGESSQNIAHFDWFEYQGNDAVY